MRHTIDTNDLQHISQTELADVNGQPIRLADFQSHQHVVLVLMRGLW